MFNGLYSGATALDVLHQQQDAIASNLAHLNTPGHRRMLISFAQRMDESAGGESRPGIELNTQTLDFSQGRQQPTGRKLDLALGGDGFFTYQGSEGKVYSRSGIVFRDPKTSQLVNGDGLALLGENGPLEVPGELSQLIIGTDGTLSSNRKPIGKLQITQFDNVHGLQSESQSYFRAGTAQPSPAESFTVHQGVRELSNGHPVSEMISLIVGSRQFEAAQRAMRMISDTIQESIQA